MTKRITHAVPLATALTATLLLAACSTPTVPLASIPAPEVAFQHIHKLEIGANGSELLVAAHNGLYRLALGPESDATVSGPIGGFDFDLMGFAINGTNAFASGHPGPITTSTFGTPHLGLISSPDLGESWTSVSLAGTVDFHALTATTGADGVERVYGIDSSKQQIQRSLDGGHTWSDGAELVARDILAVGDLLYVTTAEGFAVSDDDGTSFVIDPDAPSLFLVAADEAGQLSGVDTHGNIWMRDAEGVWTSGGVATGVPQALAVEGSRIYIVDDRGIAFTDDKGATWTEITTR